MTKVLIIDDEDSIRTMMRMTLELDGYQVLTAADGPSGLEIFQAESPGIILLDVRMPGMDGLEVLERIKAVNRETEVIIVTGHGDMDMAIKCMQKEASNFLTKPVGDELLSIALKRSLEKRALKAKIKEYTENLETLVREANVELEKAYRFRENLIENSPDAIVSVRKGGDIVIFNSAAEKLSGYAKDEVVGRMNIVKLYRQGEAKRVMNDLRSEEWGGRGILKKREMVILHKDGHEVPVYLSAAILYDGGQETGSVGVFTDLTERKELENLLLRSEKLSSLGKLSAGIAHEINQPLTGVLTFASLLLKKFKNDASTRRDLEIVVRETTRIRGIVQGMLEFARENPVKKTSVKLEEIIERTLAIVVNQQRFFGIQVTKDFDRGLPEITADPSLIEQVFLNIILNAADAMNGAGGLSIRTRRDNGWILIEFQDTGHGIHEAILTKIFDPFFTTKESSEGAGMGLGLAVTYGIVKNHDGDIEVKSKEGEGTTFTVRLPITQRQK
jgi:PAS domain S-box-containing protein